MLSMSLMLSRCALVPPGLGDTLQVDDRLKGLEGCHGTAKCGGGMVERRREIAHVELKCPTTDAMKQSHHPTVR